MYIQKVISRKNQNCGFWTGGWEMGFFNGGSLIIILSVALLWNSNELSRFRFLLSRSFVSGSSTVPDPDFCTKACLFNAGSNHVSQKVRFKFLIILPLYYILCWIRVLIHFRNWTRNRNALRFLFFWGKKLWFRFRLRFHNTEWDTKKWNITLGNHSRNSKLSMENPTRKGPFSERVIFVQDWERKSVNCVLSPGEASLHAWRTVHSSLPNTSHQDRIGQSHLVSV